MRFASGLAALLMLVGDAHAETDSRAYLTEQLLAEMQTIERALAMVDDKLDAAEAMRLRRVRAAYRILRAPLSTDASPADRMASARRRAAARLLLDRDREERALLADEATHLRSAHVRTLAATGEVPRVTLPESLLVPAEGTIARQFGTLVHERSKAVLARRGIDIAVELAAPVRAPADGVVRYAGPIRGLDHGVVLDHGDSFTVVAKLAELAIPVGTKVQRGDRLGHAARQRVYFEVRAKIGPGGLPIDPEPLLVSE